MEGYKYMSDFNYSSEEIKENTEIEDTSFDRQLIKEVNDTMKSVDDIFSTLFKSINILEVNEAIFDILQRVHYINKDVKEIKELIEDAEEKYKKQDFIEKIVSDFKYAKEKEFDSIVITIDTDLGNTYCINVTEEGFQCDLFDYLFNDLDDVSKQLYDEMQGNVVDIRIE